jgi:predicted nucleotidyltransferase
MLHNKYSAIIEHFLGDYDRRVYGRELVGKAPMSQKSISLALNELEKEGVLKSETVGKMKYFRLNTANPGLKDILLTDEMSRKTRFIRKNRKLALIFREDDRIVGIFGSYARGEQKKGSDIDVFVIGPKKQEDYERAGLKMDLDISVKYFSEGEFENLLAEKNSLCMEIVKDHVMIFGAEKFIMMLWRSYGFN